LKVVQVPSSEVGAGPSEKLWTESLAENLEENLEKIIASSGAGTGQKRSGGTIAPDIRKRWGPGCPEGERSVGSAFISKAPHLPKTGRCGAPREIGFEIRELSIVQKTAET
jgi:hypothetical protein